MRIFSHKKHRLTRPHRAPLTLPGWSEATEKERGGLGWGNWKRASLFSCLWKGKDKTGGELGTELITVTRRGRDLPAVTRSGCEVPGEGTNPRLGVLCRGERVSVAMEGGRERTGTPGGGPTWHDPLPRHGPCRSVWGSLGKFAGFIA